MKWNVLLGIEIHNKIFSFKKIFSDIKINIKKKDNYFISDIDLGFPGFIPSFKKENINKIIIFGFFMNFFIYYISYFVRKNYFYPDVSKNFQISQFEKFILNNGKLLIYNNYNYLPYYKFILIKNINIEEDAGSVTYDNFRKISKINFNRSGSFLVEIVSGLNLFDFYEVFLYIKKLQEFFIFLNISDSNMESGCYRFDVNVSVKPFYLKKNNFKIEIKNLNSFFILKKSIDFEIKRQIYLYNLNFKIKQETKFFDNKNLITYSSRSKELFSDYKYFIEPDLFYLLIKINFLKNFNFIFNKPLFLIENYYKKKNFFNYNFYNFILNKKFFFIFKKIIFTIKNYNLSIFNWLFNNIFFYFKKIYYKYIKISINQIIYIINLLKLEILSYNDSKKIFLFIIKNNIYKNNIYKILIFNKLNILNNNKKNCIFKNILYKNIKLLHELNNNKKIINLIIKKIVEKNIKININYIKNNLLKKIIFIKRDGWVV